MADFVNSNRRELFKKYSYELINTNDIEELQNLLDYCSGLIIKNSQLGDSYETKVSAKNSNTYIKACYKQDEYTNSQRDVIKKMYQESNKYYKYLLDNYNIDPLISRTAEDYDILTSVSKYRENGSSTLESYQEDLFLKCYDKAKNYWNNVTRNKSFQSEDAYRNFTELYLIFVAIQKYITERMINQFDVDTFTKFQCKNYFISNGVDYFDDLPIYYQKKLIKLLNDLQRNKGDDKIFDYIKMILSTKNLNIYKYILAKTENNTNLHFYKTPYDEELNTDTNEKYTFENITENDPYWRASKNEVLYQTFNTLDTKYISIEYVVDILKNSYLFSYFMYLLNDLMLNIKNKGQETSLQFLDNSISGSKIRLYDAIIALFSLFYVYITNDEVDGDIINKVTDDKGNSLIKNIYGYRSYINTPEVISLINNLIKKLNDKNEEIYNKYKGNEEYINDVTIQWNLDLIDFLKTFNLKNFYYSENYSLDTIIYYYENPYKMKESDTTSNSSQNCKSEFLELARFIKSRKIHDTKNDVLGLVNLYSLVLQDKVTDAFEYLMNLIFNGDLNVEFLSIHRDLKLVFKKYIAYCIINGIIPTNEEITEYNSENIYYSQNHDMFYTFFITNEVIFNEFIKYTEKNYGYDIPLLNEFLNKMYTSEGPDALIKLIKSLDGFLIEDKLLKFRNLYTYFDLFTSFKNEIFKDSSNYADDFNNSNFVSLSQNYENTNINSFMQILNKNNEMRTKLENYILECNDREIYKDLKELWKLKFQSNFDYSLYKNYSYFKDYILDNDDELFDYITNFGNFDNENDKRKEIENRILTLCTSIENYISSNENFIYNSTFNVIFSKIKDYAKTMIDVFKAYTLDTIYSKNVLSFDDKFSNNIKIFDSVENLELKDLVLTAPPEYLDIQDGIYKDDNTFDMQYIQYVQNVIDNVNYEDDGEPAVLPEYVKKYLKCKIYIYEENDLPFSLTSDKENSIEPYYPVKSYETTDEVYDGDLINDFNKEEEDEYGKIIIDDDKIKVIIKKDNRFFIRPYSDNNLWLPNRIILNQKMQKTFITIPTETYLPQTGYQKYYKDGLTYLVKNDITHNLKNTFYVYNKETNKFEYKSKDTEYPSLTINGNEYDKINLNFNKKYAVFGYYSQRDVLSMYFNMINDGKLANVSKDELTRSYVNSKGETLWHTMYLSNLYFLVKNESFTSFTSINDEFLKNFSTHGYTNPNSTTLDQDIADEMKMRMCVVLINVGDYYQFWLYTGTNKSVNNGFKYLGPSIYIDTLNVYYEPLRFYNDKSFDDKVERRELQNNERIPLTESVKIDPTTGNSYELLPEPTINKIEKVFHREYMDKDKFSIKHDTDYSYWNPAYFNVSFGSPEYGLSYDLSNGVLSSFNVNSEDFRFTIPKTINNNASLLTFYASITIPKNKSTITITTEDGNTLNDIFTSNFGFIAVKNKGITNYNNSSERPLLSKIVELNNSLGLNLNVSNINEAANKINTFSKLSRFTDDISQDTNNEVYDSNLNYNRLKTYDSTQSTYYYDYDYAKSINEIETVINSGRIKGHLSDDIFAGKLILMDENDNIIYDLDINSDKTNETFFNQDLIIDNDTILKNKQYRLIIVNTIMNTACNIGDFICNLDLDEANCKDLTINSKEIIYDNDKYGNTISCIDILFTPGYDCKIKLKLSGLIIFETIVDYDFTELNKDEYDLLFLSPYNYRKIGDSNPDSKANSGQLVYYDDGSGVEYLPYNYTLHKFTELKKNPNRKIYISTGNNSTYSCKKESNYQNTLHHVMKYWMSEDYDKEDVFHESEMQDIGNQQIISSKFNKDGIDCNYTIKQNWDINMNKWIVDNDDYKLIYGENELKIKYSSLFTNEHVIATGFPTISFRTPSNKYVTNVSFSSLLMFIDMSAFYRNKHIKTMVFSPLLNNLNNDAFKESYIEKIYFLNNSLLNPESNYIPIDKRKNSKNVYNSEKERYLIIYNDCFRNTTKFKNTHFNIKFPKNLLRVLKNSFYNSTINQIDFTNCDYLNILYESSFSLDIDNTEFDYLNRRYVLKTNGEEYKDINGNYVYEGEINDTVFGSDLQPKSGYKFSDLQGIILPHGENKFILWIKTQVFANRKFIRYVDTGNAFGVGCSAFNSCKRLNYANLPNVIYFGNFANTVLMFVHENSAKYPAKKVTCNNKIYYAYGDLFNEIIINDKYYKSYSYGKDQDGYYYMMVKSNDGDTQKVILNENYNDFRIKNENTYYINRGFRSFNVSVPDTGTFNSVFNECFSLLKVEFSNKIRIISDNNFINTGLIKFDKNNNAYLYYTTKLNNATKTSDLTKIGKLYDLNHDNIDFSTNSSKRYIIKEYYEIKNIHNISDNRISQAKLLNDNNEYEVFNDIFTIQFNMTNEEFHNIKKKINWNARTVKNKFGIESYIDNINLGDSPYSFLYSISALNETSDANPSNFTGHNYFSLSLEDSELYYSDIVNNKNPNQTFDIYSLKDFETDNPSDSNELKNLKAKARYSLKNFDSMLKIIHNNKTNPSRDIRLQSNEFNHYKEDEIDNYLTYNVDPDETYYKTDPNKINVFADRYYTDEEEYKKEFIKNYFKDLTIFKFKENSIKVNDDLGLDSPTWFATVKSKYRNITINNNQYNIPSRIFLNSNEYFNLDFENDNYTDYYISTFMKDNKKCNIYNETMDEIFEDIYTSKNPIFKDTMHYTLGYGSNRNINNDPMKKFTPAMRNISYSNYNAANKVEEITLSNGLKKYMYKNDSNFDDLINKSEQTLLTPNVLNYDSSNQFIDYDGYSQLAYGLIGNEPIRGTLNKKYNNQLIMYNCENSVPLKDINDESKNYLIQDDDIMIKLSECNDTNEDYKNNILKYDYSAKYTRYPQFTNIPNSTPTILIQNNGVTHSDNYEFNYSYIFKIYGIIINNNNKIVGIMANGWEDENNFESEYKTSNRVIYYKEDQYNILGIENKYIVDDKFKMSDIFEELIKYSNCTNYISQTNMEIYYSGGVKEITLNQNVTTLDNGYKLHM